MKRLILFLTAVMLCISSGALASVLTLPTGLSTIMTGAFQNDTSITQVTLGKNVTEIGANAFAGCTALDTVNLDAASLETIGKEAFKDDTGLTEIRIGEKVTSIGANAFAGCTNLKCVRIANPDATIDEGAFAGCSSELMLILPREGSLQAAAEAQGLDCRVTKNRALVIGERYSGTSRYLPGAAEDSAYMEAMLQSLTGTEYEVYQQDDLNDEITVDSFEGFFQSLKAVCTPDDETFLFYFSGHGSEGGELVCSDGNISGSELTKMLDPLPGKKIVIIDACFSGALIDRGDEGSPEAFTQAFMEDFKNGSEYAAREGELKQKTYSVLTACSKSESSYTLRSGTLYYGCMTCFLMKGAGYDRLSTVLGTKLEEGCAADLNKDKKLTLAELYSYVKPKVYAHMIEVSTETKKYTQSVQAWPDNCQEVIFAL